METVIVFNPNRSKALLSEPFPPPLVDPAIAAYEIHPGRIKTTGNVTLNGLRIDLDDVRNMINETGVTHLFLRFIVAPGTNQITILAGGVKDPNNNGGTWDKTKLYDYCEPCPNVCPTFI